jgi:antitoxin YefM
VKVVNYTDLRLNLKKWLNMVVDDVEEITITRKNQKDIVLISLQEYNALKETSYLLSGKNRQTILQSLAESKSGKSSPKDLIEE